MSADGRFVSYARMNNAPEKGWDLYGFFVGDGVKVEEVRITRLDTPQAKTSKIKTSPATFDSKTKKYLCLFAIYDEMYLVYHDGRHPRVVAPDRPLSNLRTTTTDQSVREVTPLPPG